MYSKSFERGRKKPSKSAYEKRALAGELSASTAESCKVMIEEDKDEEPEAPSKFSTAREARLYHGRDYQRPWSRPA